MHDPAHAVVFVVVRARADDERVAAIRHPHRTKGADVANDRRGAEANDVGRRNRRDRLAEQIGRHLRGSGRGQAVNPVVEFHRETCFKQYYWLF